MRDTLRALLALCLVCLIVFACAASAGRPAGPRVSAWWGLLFPGLFAPDEPVIFTWPLVEQVMRLLRLRA